MSRMSNYISVADTIQEIKLWLRLATFMHEPLKCALLGVLHNNSNNPLYKGLPSDPVALYHELKVNHQAIINKLLSKKVLRQEQVDLLLPPSDNKTLSEKFDVTLIVILIRNCTTLQGPLNGWDDKSPPVYDTSLAANCIRAREWRNFLHHTDPKDIDETLFKLKWKEGTQIVHFLGYMYDTNKLLRISLDPKHQLVLKSLFYALGYLKRKQQQQDNAITQIQQAIITNINNLKDINDQLGVIKEKVKYLENIQLPIIPKTCNTDLSEICLKEVLGYVANNIGEQWIDLLRFFSIPTDPLQKMVEKDQLPSKHVWRYFESASYLITWHDLNKCLEVLERCDLIEYIEAQTLVTLGLSIASSNLKKQYIRDLIDYLVEQPLSTMNKADRYVLREEGYIELAVLTAEEVDKEWSNSDRDSLMKLQYSQMSNIGMNDLFQTNDETVIVRGVAGIGKSSLLEMYALRWAEGKIFDNRNGQLRIDFLFMITCQEINTLQSGTSLAGFFRFKFPDIFRYITFEHLQMIADRVLIIVDGLDELKDVYSLETITKTAALNEMEYLKMVQILIDTKSTFIKGHKSIGCGRPKACELIKASFAKINKTKTVEVCGFSSNNIQKYIECFFSQDADTVLRVQQVLSKSNNLRVMASVPVFLWVICNVFNENLITNPIHTNTELYIYGCLVFLRNHLRLYESTRYTNLAEMVQDPNISEIIFSLAKLSVKTFMNHEAVFTDEEVDSAGCSFHLEQTGFIVKHSSSNLKSSSYQFKHLVFQEFLCSLYLCLTKDLGPFLTNRELSSCTPTMLGIHRIIYYKDNDLFTVLFKNMMQTTKSHSSLLRFFTNPFKSRSYTVYVKDKAMLDEGLSKFIRQSKDVLGQSYVTFKTNMPSFSEYAANVFESRHEFSETVIQSFPRRKVRVVAMHSTIDTRNTLYLLRSLRVKQLSYLYVPLLPKMTDDVLDLIKLVYNDKKVHRHTEVIFLEDSYNPKKSHLVYNEHEQLHQIYISYESNITELAEIIKVRTNMFSVRGLQENTYSKEQKKILFDLKDYVVKNHPKKLINVYMI